MKTLLVLCLCIISNFSLAAVERSREIDKGGSGPYKSIAAKETTLGQLRGLSAPKFKKSCKKSRIGDMTMAGADRASLKNLHGPILYVVGGSSDGATANAELDYERIQHVPVVFTNLLDGGHSGTFEQTYGGSFAKMVLNWFDW